MKITEQMNTYSLTPRYSVVDSNKNISDKIGSERNTI